MTNQRRPPCTLTMPLCGLLCLLATRSATGRPNRGPPEQRPMLGVHLGQVTPALRKANRLPRHAGVLVTRVMPDSPAKKAGLRRGDVLMRLDRRYVYTAAGVLGQLRRKKPGDHVTVDLIRRGRWLRARIRLAAYRAPEASPRRPAPRPRRRAGPSGVLQRLKSLQQEIRRLRRLIQRLKRSCRSGRR